MWSWQCGCAGEFDSTCDTQQTITYLQSRMKQASWPKSFTVEDAYELLEAGSGISLSGFTHWWRIGYNLLRLVYACEFGLILVTIPSVECVTNQPLSI